MCLSFDTLTIYSYAFAEDHRPGFDYEALSELTNEDIRLFCNTLRARLADAYNVGLSKGSPNPCYKYVSITDDDYVGGMLYDGDDLMFIEAAYEVIAVNKSALEGKPAQIEERYKAAYGDEVVALALQEARCKMRESAEANLEKLRALEVA